MGAREEVARALEAMAEVAAATVEAGEEKEVKAPSVAGAVAAEVMVVVAKCCSPQSSSGCSSNQRYHCRKQRCLHPPAACSRPLPCRRSLGTDRQPHCIATSTRYLRS